MKGGNPMRFRKFLRNLVVFIILTALFAPVGYKEYQRLAKQKEAQELARNFVPRKVSPYQENPDDILYYYRSIGGEQYFPDNWFGVPERSLDGPACIILDGLDVTEQTRYDAFVKTVIFPEALMAQISIGEHWVNMLDEEGTVYCGYTLRVAEECTFNVPALHACLYAHDRQLIYSMADNNDITLYVNNIGDNPIVDVVRFKVDAWGVVYTPSTYLAPEDYTISEAGNKVTISGEYLSNQKVHDRVTLGFRLADGTIMEPEEHHIWIMEDEWDGFVFTDMQDNYSLSSGEDFVLHYLMQKSTIFYGFDLINITDGNYTVYFKCRDTQDGKFIYNEDDFVEANEYVDFETNVITLPPELLSTLPAGQYMLCSFHWFGRPSGARVTDEGLWSYGLYFFEITP